jgi:hypothetical protein
MSPFASPQAATAGAPAQPAPATTITQAPPPPAVEGATASQVYQAYRSQLRVLRDQLENLDESRRELVQGLREGPAGDADRLGLEQRLASVDQQIAAKQIAIAEAEARVAAQAAIPGASQEPPRPAEPLRPGDVAEMSAVIFTILAFPIALAYARRVWRRSSVTINLPAELTDRLGSLERSIDTVAVEVERIGEGQRFVTQLMADRARATPLASGRPEGHV